MVFRRTRKHFAKNYDKLKRNTSVIERNLRESVKTGIEMLDHIDKDSKELYHTSSNRANKNPYFRTARKYFSSKKNKSYRKRGGTKRSRSLSWDDDGYKPPQESIEEKETREKKKHAFANYIKRQHDMELIKREYNRTHISPKDLSEKRSTRNFK